MPDQDNGWGEWSKHVLKELERLNDNHEALRDKLDDLSKQVTEIKSGLTGVDDLKTWKHNMDEVISPSQVKSLQKDVEELKMFRAKVIAVLTVLHILVVIALTVFGLK
jgi:predicted  nucleic acid-binding Zn-ribbon protein